MSDFQNKIIENNNAKNKLSSFQKLSPAQELLKKDILAFCKDHQKDEHAIFVIEGDAGTGKSLVINSIFNDLQRMSRNDHLGGCFSGKENYLIVNHPEMMKLYTNISEDFPYIRKKDFERPTTFINKMNKLGKRADVVLIDEAHLLLTRSDKYNRFNQNNHLEEIIKFARIVILVFDEKQILKFKSYWNKKTLSKILEGFPVRAFYLTDQFRMHAKADVLEWIKNFCSKKVTSFPKKQSFDFRCFEDAQEMYELIKQKNNQYGLSRIVATYDYPYRLDGKEHFIDEGRFHLRWDLSKPDEKLPWAERPDTINEVGSVYTVQGFDLNYVGLILGPSVTYDAQAECLRLDPARYEDGAAFAGKGGLAQPEQVKEQIMLNAINVLMTRSVKGLYIYAHDPALREKLLQEQSLRS
ncbi:MULTISPECIES: DUF2075 domain-containing protein [Acetobacter]|uniref:AAA+ ATPase domain-containing protein n=1 Tax=Acetobacter pomorum DM001 TaxID=945681 RepID=F1YUA7_9PROT|nr:MULTISPECIES: DUF2075 domain-containing protein [Acetobacter]ATI12272.1 DUF2075 domain-containing protein [Acetobacter pomorum]AXC25366.1 DUF2075 domain-containing protein [Acetobacter sp. JWB]EGE47546.1 Hypothetical protein APO_1528 [Acetobacter pomorum DM001]KAA8423485.1 DUF2075 domain-containing protein [Acetobacter pomorum]KAA8435323.1 DUF2075 domain-containing protein [Acetobacter pomorum]